MNVETKSGLMPAVLVALTSALAGCGGLGEGVQPVSAVILPFGGLVGDTTTKAFTCLTTGISLFVDFSNGSRGDFTSRATYTSSNPAVARISNFDLAVPEQAGLFYNKGIITPLSAGTTTITANYLTLSRSIEVTVSPIQNITIQPASADVAANARLRFSSMADLDGVSTDISQATRWAFVTPDTTIATIDSATGVVTGVAAGTGLVARVRIPGCDMTADAPLAVANLQSLALTREFGAKDSLVVNTSEKLIATGTLDNGKTQDLSTQVTYTSSDGTAVGFLTTTIPNLVVALKASTPVQLAASFASPAVAAPAISITPVADSLNSIAVTPATADVAVGGNVQLSAIGSYASGATQDISRHVGWSSSDTAIASVLTSSSAGISSFAGLASVAPNAAGKTATVTAATTNAASQAVSSAAVLSIK